MTDKVIHGATDGNAGFTLAEVLVVLAIVSLLTGALFAGLRLGYKAWYGTTSHLGAVERVAMSQDVIRRMISGAYPMLVPSGANGSKVDFIGSESEVQFLAPTPISRGRVGWSRAVLRYDKVKRSLVISLQPELALDQTSGAVSEVLLRDLANVEFSYLGADRGEGLTWRSAWMTQTRMPEAVRMRIQFPEGDKRYWPDLVVVPRIDVDVSCVYDLLTKRCRGQ